jgi:hypothetical protein
MICRVNAHFVDDFTVATVLRSSLLVPGMHGKDGNLELALDQFTEDSTRWVALCTVQRREIGFTNDPKSMVPY